MSELYKLSYGEVLRELRIYHDYTQKELSAHLNITSQAYSNYETNKRTPDVEMLDKIAKFYNLTIDQLLSYRFTNQIEESQNYFAKPTLYRAVSDTGIIIPITAKQAKLLTDILSLTSEQQDACKKLIDLFIINPNS